MISHADEVAASYREDPAHHDDPPLPTCAWCCRTISDDEDEVVTDAPDHYHAECDQQRADEDTLLSVVRQCAIALESAKADYLAKHPTRHLEHRSRGHLSRIVEMVKAADIQFSKN